MNALKGRLPSRDTTVQRLSSMGTVISRCTSFLAVSLLTLLADTMRESRQSQALAEYMTAAEHSPFSKRTRKASVDRGVQTTRSETWPPGNTDDDRRMFYGGQCRADTWGELCARFLVASSSAIRFRVHATERDGNCAFHAFIQTYTKRFTQSGRVEFNALREFLRDYVTMNMRSPVVQNFLQQDHQRDVRDFEAAWAGAEVLALLAHAFNIIVLVIETDLQVPFVFTSPIAPHENVADVMRRPVIFLAKTAGHYEALEVLQSSPLRRHQEQLGTCGSDEEDVLDFPNRDVLSIMLQLADRDSDLWETIAATLNPELPPQTDTEEYNPDDEDFAIETGNMSPLPCRHPYAPRDPPPLYVGGLCTIDEDRRLETVT